MLQLKVLGYSNIHLPFFSTLNYVHNYITNNLVISHDKLLTVPQSIEMMEKWMKNEIY